MNAIVYYITLPFLYLISILPFWMLYKVSKGSYFIIYYILGYRKKIVLKNLKNSFPKKSEREILKIRKKYYKYFCDLLLETIKTLTISPKAAQKHVCVQNTEIINKFYKENKSIIIVLGHFGNWELSGASFSQIGLHKMYIIYHPLSNKYFDKLFYRMRTRLGNKLYTMNDTLKGMLKNKKKLTATAFIADQTPSPKGAYWTKFLNQDTPVFVGTEKIAKKLNYPVIYASIIRIKRGKYNLNFELLVENSKDTKEGEITKLHTCRLEKDIQKMPEIWLWSHRRWKHKKPDIETVSKS